MRRYDAASCRNRASQEIVDRGEEGEDVALARAVAHQADAPRLPRELTEAAADLDAVPLEQALAQRGVVGAVGQPCGRELGQPVSLLRGETEAALGQPRVQQRADARVTLP